MQAILKKVLLVQLILLATTAEASLASACHDLFDSVMGRLTIDYTGNVVEIQTPESGTFRFSIEKKLANGMAGGVYLGKETFHHQDSPTYPYGEIIKIPHTFKRGFTHPLSKKAIANEVKLYEMTANSRESIEKDVPELGYWPVGPISNTGQTPYGDVILKPFIKARTFADILKERGGFGKLNKGEKESLDKIRQFVLSVEKVLEKDHSLKGRVDANPKNLAWVEDPISLKILGMKKPGLVFFELTVETGLWGKPWLDFIRNRFFFGEP